ncbi:hypothetical protein [Methylocapsa palsarum]|uniref:Uncharacterized protein n=1 Tax=Methylocapsa palsarum TaxID=1612308 RepID=A0A1I4BLZ0_9HYPH|nr:hypothetical protein [Methylocapsa palsarum]SFK68986.1 hypothetical protein SAMN05444581_11551 [Methylocapsa palsarum]
MTEESKGLWQTIKPDIVKLLTVGVLGSVLSGMFGFATWVRDKRLARLEENIKNAEQIHLDAIALAHERWYRSFRLLDELSQTASPRPGHDDRLKDAAKIYDDVLTRWNLVDATFLSRIDMAVDSALGNSVPVSLRDISKIDCHNAFFRNAHGDQIRELDRLSVKTWHIGMSHCFIQLNDAIKTVRNHLDGNGRPDNPKLFLDDLKIAQTISGDVYVNASLYRTTFEQRLMELKAKEVVYYAEASKLQDYFNLKRNADQSLIPVN